MTVMTDDREPVVDDVPQGGAPPKYVSINSAAVQTGLSIRMVHKAIESGELRTMEIAGRTLVSERSIQDLLQKMRDNA